MSKEQRIAHLYHRWMNKSASDEELKELFRLLEDNVPEVMNELIEKQWTTEDGQFDYPEGRRRYALQRILEQYPGKKKSVVIEQTFLYRFVAACFILLVITFCYHWIANNKATESNMMADMQDIPPGMAGAILTLADGSQVALDSIKNGVVALQGGAIAKVVNGALVYEGNATEPMYNTISTPNGRCFRLALSDGTQVWLNAGSSIRYPTVFAGNERRVEITGEAYFEVVKNKMKPFRLSVNNREEVEVLGTHFNINAYDNEDAITTTLIEGAIKVGGLPSEMGKQVMLKPGQQAQVGGSVNGVEIKVINNADMAKVMAWKNGVFDFQEASLAEVMRQLERWYDIEVVYEKGVPDIHFIGKMSKGLSLKSVLKGLNESEVHFRMEGRRLIIVP